MGNQRIPMVNSFEKTQKSSVFNPFEKPKNVVKSPFKFDKTTAVQPFKFENPKNSPFKLGQMNNSTSKFDEFPNNSKPITTKDCFLGLKNSTQINFSKSITPIKKSAESQTQPIEKTAENPDTSFILEHCKFKIAKEIELNNSIEYNLQ